MRILLVEASGRGFLCHYAHALALGLHQAGHQVRLLTGDRDELAAWELPFPKAACLASGWNGWRCLARAVSSYEPEVVHLQWVGSALAALLFTRWARRRGVRVVYTPHNILPHERRWLVMPLYRLLYGEVDRIVARDRHLAWALEELLGASRERVMLLPGSPNLLAHPDIPRREPAGLPAPEPGELRLLFFGHGCSRKGLDGLLGLLAGRPWPASLHLVVAGEGVLRGVDPALLEQVRRRLHLTVIDHYVEPAAVAGLFTGADLLLMPYVKQCKSPLLDLAAAFRLPALRSDRVQGAAFWEGVHGVTVAHDDALALRTALVGLLERPERLAAMRRALAREGGVESAIHRLAAGHVHLYRQLVRVPEAGERVGAEILDPGLDGSWRG
jgi:glycosyltransferase involved in cell wall biosynthesis